MVPDLPWTPLTDEGMRHAAMQASLQVFSCSWTLPIYLPRPSRSSELLHCLAFSRDAAFGLVLSVCSAYAPAIHAQAARRVEGTEEVVAYANASLIPRLAMVSILAPRQVSAKRLRATAASASAMM